MGRRIRARRDKMGLTQYALAERIEVSQGAITAWENGRRAPKWDELPRLSQALDVSGAWIIDPLIDDHGTPGGSTVESGEN